MAHINVAVIYDKDDVINKVYDLIPEYIDFLSQLNINNSPEYRRIKKITIFDTVRGEWKVDSNNINLLNKELHNLFSESNQ